MSFVSVDGLRYWRFENFEAGVCQAVFTRHGGVSPEPWASLNLGGTVGDELERVRENRRRLLTALGRDPAGVYDVYQVHGTNVAVATAPRLPETPPLQADAILTDRPGLVLLMRFADCVPVLLYDPRRGVAGIAHAGWMGTVRGTLRAAIDAMQAQFGCKPADVQAAIGPSIGPDHYEVGADVVHQVRTAFGQQAGSLLKEQAGRIHFNLWAANRLALEQAGVTHIETAGLCTVCHNQDWYSHRAEKGRTGRFGALIALE